MTGCVPDGLRDVPNNDFVRLGLPFCSEHPCVSGGAVVDATNTGLISDCGMLLAARDTLGWDCLTKLVGGHSYRGLDRCRAW